MQLIAMSIPIEFNTLNVLDTDLKIDLDPKSALASCSMTYSMSLICCVNMW